MDQQRDRLSRSLGSGRRERGSRPDLTLRVSIRGQERDRKEQNEASEESPATLDCVSSISTPIARIRSFSLGSETLWSTVRPTACLLRLQSVSQ